MVLLRLIRWHLILWVDNVQLACLNSCSRIVVEVDELKVYAVFIGSIQLCELCCAEGCLYLSSVQSDRKNNRVPLSWVKVSLQTKGLVLFPVNLLIKIVNRFLILGNNKIQFALTTIAECKRVKACPRACRTFLYLNTECQAFTITDINSH